MFGRRIPRADRETLAVQILAHLRERSAVMGPAVYQFVLPEQSLLTVSDLDTSPRPTLTVLAYRASRVMREIVWLQVWPRDVPRSAGWFGWPMTERQQRRLRKSIEHCIEVAYDNRDGESVEGAILIDPATPSTRL